MRYDLRTEPWIPLRRSSGIVEWVPPSALTDQLDADPFVAVASPRPDFDGALTEFLIGLLAAALEPADEDAWLALWHNPPTPEQISDRLATLPDAFDLTAAGPAFLQDLDRDALQDADPSRPEQLLLDAPGDQGVRLNTDLFVKRQPEARFGRPVAAMALLTLQTYAPSGGKGHRVSLRGGGPLTTLVDPRTPASAASVRERALWWMLLANLPTADWLCEAPFGPRRHEAAARFPWMAATRASQGKTVTLPTDADALQCFFGMPRRIRLDFEQNAGVCTLARCEDAAQLRGFSMVNYGTRYLHWQHPLTPYYRASGGGEWLPVLGKAEGVSWRDWLGFVLGTPDESRRPATCVGRFAQLRARAVGCTRFGLRVWGYDFDNMKARAWIDASMPAFVTTADRLAVMRDVARGCVQATELAASLAKGAVERALHAADTAADKGTEVKRVVWEALEGPFYEQMQRLAAGADVADPGYSRRAADQFLRIIEQTSMSAFDMHCSVGEPNPMTVRRTVANRRQLVDSLKGYGPMGRKLFDALGIPGPVMVGAGSGPRKGRSIPTKAAVDSMASRRRKL